MVDEGDICPECSIGVMVLQDEEGDQKTLRCTNCDLSVIVPTNIEPVKETMEDKGIQDIPKKTFRDLGFRVMKDKAEFSQRITLVVNLETGEMFMKGYDNRDLLHNLPIYESLLTQVRKIEEESEDE